ncbi:hypothetical protein ACFQ07_31825 [Actinomadura adrarensis]|uniref:Uncharacterized protein n=1 Tax=Actinomadura adrarensis TaxID=1819600 RepID=A0ABW3CQP9_9ACTN
MTTIFTPERLRREMTELVFEHSPRRFALCWLDFEEDDGGVLAWGLEFESGRAVVCGESGTHLGCFSSAEHARLLHARRREVMLVWNDDGVPFTIEDEP